MKGPKKLLSMIGLLVMLVAMLVLTAGVKVLTMALWKSRKTDTQLAGLAS